MEKLTEQQKEIFEAYYYKNSEYYIERLEKYINNEKNTFSIKGFFLGLFWMSYRKMYKIVIIIFLILLFETYLEEILYAYNLMPEFLYQLLGKAGLIIWGTIYGFIANRLYIAKSIKDIDKISNSYSDIEQCKERAKLKGGVNWFAPFVLLLIIIVLLIIAT